MKKTALVATGSFLFLLIASLVAYVLRYVETADAITFLIIGICTLLGGAALAYFSSEIVGLNVLCFSISAVALGFLIRSWYIFRGFDNSIAVMLLVCVACTVYLWIFCLLAQLPLIKEHIVFCAFIYAIISLVAYIIVVFTTNTTYVSTFGYYMIVEIAFVYALVREADSISELIRSVTICTFSVFGVAFTIALMICAGDSDCGIDCSCCDCCDLEIGGKKKKK